MFGAIIATTAICLMLALVVNETNTRIVFVDVGASLVVLGSFTWVIGILFGLW